MAFFAVFTNNTNNITERVQIDVEENIYDVLYYS